MNYYFVRTKQEFSLLFFSSYVPLGLPYWSVVNSVKKKKRGCNKNANVSMGYCEQEYSYFHLFGHMEYTEYATAHACKTSDRQSYRSPLPCSVLKHTRKYRNTTVHGIPLHHYRKYDLKKNTTFSASLSQNFITLLLNYFLKGPHKARLF